MIDLGFREIIESNAGCALILTGSESDESHIRIIGDALNRYTVPYQVHIASAQKQSVDLLKVLEEYDVIKGALAYIAVAGGTNDLSGVVSFHTYRQVISCLPNRLNQSCFYNPPGSSNGFVLLPDICARLVAQMWSCYNPTYRDLLRLDNEQRNERLRRTYKHIKATFY